MNPEHQSTFRSSDDDQEQKEKLNEDYATKRMENEANNNLDQTKL